MNSILCFPDFDRFSLSAAGVFMCVMHFVEACTFSAGCDPAYVKCIIGA